MSSASSASGSGSVPMDESPDQKEELKEQVQDADHHQKLSHEFEQETGIPRDLLVMVLGETLKGIYIPNKYPATNTKSPPHVLCFQGVQLPQIDICAYFQRIAFYSECSNEALVLSLIQLVRIQTRERKFVANPTTIHRLLLTSVMIMAKYMDDHFFNNKFYAKVGGIPTSELNQLEVEFLKLSDYKIAVSEKQFVAVYRHLVVDNPLLEPCKSKWILQQQKTTTLPMSVSPSPASPASPASPTPEFSKIQIQT